MAFHGMNGMALKATGKGFMTFIDQTFGGILEAMGHGFEVMPHLTCVGHTRDELLEILEEFAEAGFRNVMALRGDPPKGETTFKPVPAG